MESPHISEIRDKWPATGTAGEIMSRVILNNNWAAFGKLLKEGDSTAKLFAIMNVSQIPMQVSAYDHNIRHLQELRKLDNLRSFNEQQYNITEHKVQIKRAAGFRVVSLLRHSSRMC